MVDGQTISEVQELYLKLIERHSYNEFDGQRVARELRTHRELWDAAIMLRNEIGIMLRDLVDVNNVDTLYLATTRDRIERLRALTADWGAEVEEVRLDFGIDFHDRTCLRLWWD